ncbi:MAG: divalent metal cation transporter [Armatimonadota bacterium]|nr:divalent metal cation transporter [Armatimonadota bacterium]
MRNKLSRHRLAPILAAIGPGIIAANADNDAGGITTYSLAGAHFGYSLIWVLILITFSLGVTQEMGARMGMVTGKGFGGLIREKFGARWAAFAILIMLLANIGTTTAEFSGIASSLEIFGISKYISIPLSVIGVFMLVARYDYRRVQRVFLIISMLYLSYVASGFLARPNWNEALVSIVKPDIQWNLPYLIMFVGVVGTTITPWGQFFIQSYVVDKRLRAKDLPYARADVYVGAFFTDFIAFFIIVACAAKIYPLVMQGFKIEDAADVALALQPLAGRFASILFGIGLLNASLLGAVILPLTSSYATAETFGWEAGLDKTPREAPIFFGLFLFFLLIPSLIVLIPGLPLLHFMFYPQVLNGILLPIILIFVLKITNDQFFMGEYTNSRAFNIIALITTIGLIILTILLLATPLIQRYA